MAIPRKQIGWSQESNLIWEINKRLEKLNNILSCVCTPPSTPPICFNFISIFVEDVTLFSTSLSPSGTYNGKPKYSVTVGTTPVVIRWNQSLSRWEAIDLSVDPDFVFSILNSPTPVGTWEAVSEASLVYLQFSSEGQCCNCVKIEIIDPQEPSYIGTYTTCDGQTAEWIIFTETENNISICTPTPQTITYPETLDFISTTFTGPCSAETVGIDPPVTLYICPPPPPIT